LVAAVVILGAGVAVVVILGAGVAVGVILGAGVAIVSAWAAVVHTCTLAVGVAVVAIPAVATVAPELLPEEEVVVVGQQTGVVCAAVVVRRVRR
jgi:hypothetical protein